MDSRNITQTMKKTAAEYSNTANEIYVHACRFFLLFQHATLSMPELRSTQN